MTAGVTVFLGTLLLLQVSDTTSFVSISSPVDTRAHKPSAFGGCRSQMLQQHVRTSRRRVSMTARIDFEDDGPQFPAGMQEVLTQCAVSVDAALQGGFHRMRVQINCKEFDLRTTPYSKSLVPYFVELVGKQLAHRGLRVSFLFNTLSDAAEARSLLSGDLMETAKIDVLGLGDFRPDLDAIVLVCPSNEGNENLRRIEAVEKVIYRGPPRSMSSRRERAKFMLRPVILFNPFLEAIHPTATETRKVAPMFMSDFQMVYFLEPCIMQLAQGDDVVETSLFKAHPHNWQLWAREAPRGYTKVWEESVVPTAVDKAMLRDVRDRSRAPKGW